MRTINSSVFVLLLGAVTACSGSDSGSTGGGGGDTSVGGSNGGSVATGGAASPGGGAIGVGGTTSVGTSSVGGATGAGGSNNGGANATGGAVGVGGTASTGGTKTTGGSSNAGGGTPAVGGTANTGGTKATGGMTTAGGVSNTAGTSSTGGSRAGGGTSSTGGSKAAGGGTTAGGASATGGSKATGGTPSTGGSKATGGMPATGGSNATGGTTGNCPAPKANLFEIGADITDQEPQPVATRGNLLTIMKSHGFNYIRLRTFVDPKAADGYDQTNGYDDITHTVDFGKQIKDACMGLLVDFHYSDNWADPGKQCVPVAWQGYTTIADLATAVHDYTKDAITKLVAGGARPDMVQIGNETTPGMLLNVCDSGGQPTGNNQITGSTSNWANLGALLKAGVQGVKDVDPTILISFHIDRGGDKPTDTAGAALNTSINWLTNAMKYVTPDAFGESCYQAYQGDPNSAANTKTTWTNTFAGLVAKFPSMKFFAAEYGPLQREINDVLFNLPNNQGIGTYNWEPTTQGAWNTGHDLLRRNGTTYTAQPDLALYDLMMTAYASRL